MAQFFNDLPGVRRKEVDLSDVLSTRTGLTVGTAIRSTQGRINRPYVVTSQSEFINNFGTPYFGSGTAVPIAGYETAYVPNLGYGTHAAFYTLSETNSMVVVRDASTTDKYSTASVNLFSRGTSGTSGTSAVGFTSTSAAVNSSLWSQGQMFDTDSFISSIESSAVAGSVCFSHVAPTVYGDNFAVTVEFLSSASDWAYKYDTYPVVPSGTNVEAYVFSATSSIVANLPKASEICKVVVFAKQDGKNWTDYYSSPADQTAGLLRLTPIETYFVSFKKLLDDDGNSLYAPDVINNTSKNIYINVGVSRSDISISAASVINSYSSAISPTGSDNSGFYVKNSHLVKLGGGSYDLTKAKTTESSWSMLHDRKQIVLDFVLGYSSDSDEKGWAAAIVSDRRDCFAELQSHSVGTVDVSAIIANESYSFSAPSYVGLNVGFSKVYDSYNGRDVFLPNVVFALMANLRTIRNGHPWDVPAGTQRGSVPVKAQLKIYSDVEMDRLISRNLNPVSFERGYGYVMISYRTAQLKKSALDRKNVRFNLLYIENNIETFLKQFLFELNTPSTRLRAYVGGNEFLDNIKKSGGLYAYTVICDESNNGAAVIDTNTMNYTIGVQPVKGIDWINFTTVVTRTGADFNTLKIQYE